MNLIPHLPSHAESTISQFLRAHTLGPGTGGAVIGLSGGIDSALCTRLLADAIGPDRVLTVVLPDAAFPSTLLAEVAAYATSLGVEQRVLRIDGVEAAVRSIVPETIDRTTWGNVKARVRMLLLYTLARERGRRVVGTGNKSELLLGYFTKYGDGGADLLPIGDLYKTQVRELAARLELPAAVRDRPPTAGLWEGQTDEAELGLPYALLDQILAGIEQLVPIDRIAAELGQPPSVVADVERRVIEGRHKRRLAPIAKVGLRTVGLDWRE
ncbi:MAG: NAD+ synthase [Thermoplasmata archaeon]|nr:NAD+ synthase [Thermoplasmata archaeon]